MSRNTVIGLVAVLVLGFIGWSILGSQKSTTTTSPAQTTTPTSTQTSEPSATEGAIMKETGATVVKITSAGFVPQNIIIKKGQSVTWVNEDIENHTVNSAPHPTHTTYSRLNIGAIKPGDQAPLSFTDAGSYKYHDHLNPSLTGSVTVE